MDLRSCTNTDCQNHDGDDGCTLDYVTLDATGQCEQEVTEEEAADAVAGKSSDAEAE